MMDVSARITLFIYVVHRNSTKSEGRLSYNHIFYIYFLACEFCENEGRLSYNNMFYLLLGIGIPRK